MHIDVFWCKGNARKTLAWKLEACLYNVPLLLDTVVSRRFGPVVIASGHRSVWYGTC